MKTTSDMQQSSGVLFRAGEETLAHVESEWFIHDYFSH